MFAYSGNGSKGHLANITMESPQISITWSVESLFPVFPLLWNSVNSEKRKPKDPAQDFSKTEFEALLHIHTVSWRLNFWTNYKVSLITWFVWRLWWWVIGPKVQKVKSTISSDRELNAEGQRYGSFCKIGTKKELADLQAESLYSDYLMHLLLPAT